MATQRAVSSRLSSSAPLRWWAPALIVALGLLAYATSFSGAFVLDDRSDIVDNPRIREVWSWAAWRSTRPLVQWLLAANYAVGGLSPWSYHAANLLIHLLAGLALFGVARRTLELPSMPARYRSASTVLAAAAAALWVVHPAQTQSVTYVIQRAEALAGLWTLTSLYALIRSDGGGRAWPVATVAAAVLGIASKPTAAVTPLLLAAYDRMFLSASWAAMWRRRGRLYASLIGTWLIGGALLRLAPEEFRGTAGIGIPGATPWGYWLTQPAVLLEYARVAVWPAGLVFDYGWPRTVAWWEAVAPAAAVAAAAVLVALGLRHGRRWAWLGVWIGATLAPTSLVPLADPAFAHRLYLPLAGGVAALVLGGFALGGRLPVSTRARAALGTVALLAVASGWTIGTARRNRDFRSEARLWADTAHKRPRNPRAHGLLGVALAESGRRAEARSHLLTAWRLDPANAEWSYNLGLLAATLDRRDDAQAWFAQALALRPTDAALLRDTAIAARDLLPPDRAAALLRDAMAADPLDDRAPAALAAWLVRRGALAEAADAYRETLRRNPRHPSAHNDLGVVLAHLGHLSDAATQFQRALELDAGDLHARENLELIRPQMRRAAE